MRGLLDYMVRDFDWMFKGKWRIIDMTEGGKALIDSSKPEYIEFIKSGFGFLYFGCTPENLYYQVNERGRVKFLFLGIHEAWEVFGKGFCQIYRGQLQGLILLKEGIWSEFIAQKAL
jgi:hypothetical protein